MTLGLIAKKVKKKRMINMEKDIRPDKWALVTGSSSGIGREIVKLLESYGYGSILVARRRSRLEDLAEVLKYKSYIIEAELSQSSTAKDLCKKVDQ